MLTCISPNVLSLFTLVTDGATPLLARDTADSLLVADIELCLREEFFPAEIDIYNNEEGRCNEIMNKRGSTIMHRLCSKPHDQ